MGRLSDTAYEPDPARRAIYDALYGEYRRLHDLFGRRGDDVMRNLKRIQHDAIARRGVHAAP
jgi:L-ribulokinase